MKKFRRNPIVTLLVAFFMLISFVLFGPIAAQAATAPTLGDAASFAVLGATTVTNTGSTVLNGDLGLYSGTSITGFFGTTANEGPGVVTAGYFVHQTDALAHTAQTAATNAYNSMASQACPNDLSGQDLGGMTLTPGVYCFDTSAGLTGVLTLNAQGDPNAVWIFQIGTTLTTASGSSVVFSNGGSGTPGCNVYWQVGTAATLGTSTTFVGTIIAQTEAITLTTGATLLGRALSSIAAVTLGANTITVPTCAAAPSLTLNKILVKNNGGTAVESDWTLTATGPITLSGPGAAGSADVVSDGTFLAGTYTLSEPGPAGYSASLWSCTNGITVTSGQITLANGQSTVCTITNDDIAPAPAPATLHIIKHVINDNGGSATASNFIINVTGTTNISPSSFAGSEIGVDVTLDAGSYSVTETGPSGYLLSGSGNCSGTIAAGETKTCTITNDDIAPTLVVNKSIINDNGGTKLFPADFLLKLDGLAVTHGAVNTITIGLHTVSETPDSGYNTTISGDCAANGTITLALGEVKTCTITNDDIAPVVVPPSSGSGGSRSSYFAPVPPLIDLVKVPNPLALPDGSGTVEYTYTLRNIGTIPVTNITMVGDTCSPIILVSGDTDADAKLDVNEIWTYSCSTTLSKTHTNVVTTTGQANGITAIDIANATVIVGVPVVPPLIHVTKVPSPLTLPAGGGIVTYTKKVTNPGTVALSNVHLTDDKCASVKYISGDTNGDSKLDPTETWTYTCQTNLTKTTTNTAIASGDANGLTARDFAIATVVVAPTVAATAVPALPNTGIAPDEKGTPWNIIILSGILILVLTSFIIIPRLRRGFGGQVRKRII